MSLKNQNGVAAVEFAIVFPILVSLLFGTIEVGLLIYNKQVIINASREGVRAGITGEPTDKIKEVVSNYCNEYLINLGHPEDLHAKPDPTDINVSGPDADNDLTVTISYAHHYAFAAIIGLNDTIINSQTVMRMEDY